MKKIKWFVLLTFLAFVLVACNNNVENSTDKTENNEVTENEAISEESDKVNIYLTRHGKTIFNTMDRVQGWSDTPLTEEGREVAVDLGKGLKDEPLDAMYSSDAGRSRETAEIVIEESGQTNLELITLTDFREMYFGKYEGDPNQVMWNDILELLDVEDMDTIMAGGYNFNQVIDAVAELDETGEAETWEEYSTRLQAGLDYIVEQALENGDTDIMIVAHGMSIGSMLHMIDHNQEIVHVDNSSVTKLVYENGNYSIESINDLSYVENGKAAKE